MWPDPGILSSEGVEVLLYALFLSVPCALMVLLVLDAASRRDD